MAPNIEAEIEREFREARQMCANDPDNPELQGETGFRMAVMNNFWTKIPGGPDYWECKGGVWVKRNSEEIIGEWFRKVLPEERWGEIAKYSDKYMGNTYGGLANEVGRALLGAGMEESLLKEFSEVDNIRGIRPVFNRNRDENTEFLFGAYQTLRRSGYTETDLT